MPRPPRIEFAGALYHVTSRGNGRARLFFGDSDCERFLLQLQDNIDTYEVILYAYVLMQNHYHLLVRTRHANLSRFMQRLNTSYALYSRYKHRKPGHRLERRFHGKLVEGDDYALTLTRYIHLNPVKVAAAGAWDRTERLRRLESTRRWSSYGGYVDERRVEPFVCYDVLKSLGGKPTEARDRYRAYVQACLLKDDEPLRDLLQKSRHGIGSEEYIRELESKLRGRKTGDVRDRDVAFPKPWADVTWIDEVVSAEFGVPSGSFKMNGHAKGVGWAKAMAIELACRLTGLTQREIGGRYGGISSQAVSLARRKVREQGDGATLSRLVKAIEQRRRVG